MSRSANKATGLTQVIPLRSFVAWAVGVGVALPTLYMLLYRTFLKDNPAFWDWAMTVPLDGVMLTLWPSSIMLMADPNDESIAIPVFSIAVNGALYAGLGWLVWFGLYKNRIVFAGTSAVILFGFYKLIGLYVGW